MSENLFTDGGNDAPEFELAKADADNGVGLLDLLVATKLCSSKGEARKMIEGGGISVDGNKISDTTLYLKTSDFHDNAILLKKGKKNFVKVVLR